ncbi:MAG: nicotinamide-nucleotide adenylyltransferase [Candidatus Altiarchaeota archaeon]|nr:nicotinamide-nucleotide adenylyltransferase [Candidatus Altiarchaeota archaeon]
MTALIIGRFQPFHLGHLMLIKEAARDCGFIMLGIGSSQESHTQENPFTAGERREMIIRSLEIPPKFAVYDIPDIGDNRRWVSHVEKLVSGFDVVYTNGELERRLFREAGYRIHATGFFNRERYSGVEIRRRILSGEEWKDLVPTGTLEVMKEIRGLERIKSLG